MAALIDLTDQRYGRLIVLRRGENNKHRQLHWVCQCDCGKTCTPLGMTLRKGQSQSCGCLHKEVTGEINRSHGMTRTPIYAIWHSMMQRCYNTNNHAYNRYGGRGITVVDDWHNFKVFYKDMGDKPKGKSLERLDNSGPYSLKNVTWADAKQQANNRRSNVVLDFKGRKQTMQQWSDETGLKVQTVWARLNRGWSVDRALTEVV
jgi:hypothetical protein